MAARKRTIDAFFGSPASKKAKPTITLDNNNNKISPNNIRTSSPTPTAAAAVAAGTTTTPSPQEDPGLSEHYTYPFPIAHLPRHISSELSSLPCSIERIINDQPDLDLVYYEPYIPRSTARDLFRHLRSSLPFYRVEYDIQRGGVSTHIRTPRWTTVFGVDETSRFASSPPSSTSLAGAAEQQKQPDNNTAYLSLFDAKTNKPLDPAKEKLYSGYTHPRPIPKCLDDLRLSTERATGCKFNFCLVNYYATGSDSISFHSDDERFLGPMPAIASFSLGARRDFLMKHKPAPVPAAKGNAKTTGTKTNTIQASDNNKPPLKLPLGSGDMVLMRGATQANWLHSIPKRSGKNSEADLGRINITFRRAMVKGGTDNYYRYNVGSGPVYTWDDTYQEMRPWTKKAEGNLER